MPDEDHVAIGTVNRFLVAVTSSSRDVVGFCTEITLYPLSTSGLITLFQEEPSAGQKLS
jgi:hypothetical protein